jgi:C-terminal peptidase prc
MKQTRSLLLTLALLIACAPRTPLPTASLEPTQRPTTIPTPTPIVVTAASPTPIVEPTPTAASTLDPETTTRHQRIFEQVWNTVDAQYVYPDFNGLNWAAVYDEFRARIDAGLSDEDFWRAMSEMIDRLGDDHSTFVTPAEAQEEDAQLQGDLSYVGIGVYSGIQADKQQAVIFTVFPGSPADEAGLRAHDAILAIDGRPVVAADGASNLDLLRGPSGVDLALRVRSPGEAPREGFLIRRRIDGALRATGQLLDSPDGRRIGYLMVPSLWDAGIKSSARQALAALMAGGRLDSLIVDMRINGGGVSTNLLALLGIFTDGQRGEFAGRDQPRPLTVIAEPIGNSQDVPLIILVGPDTESYAEVFSGVLREAGRARLVGMTTAGNIETVYGYDFEDGSRAWIARETFVPPSGEDWEQAGLVPDMIVDAAWDEFTDEDDPCLAAALQLLVQP